MAARSTTTTPCSGATSVAASRDRPALHAFSGIRGAASTSLSQPRPEPRAQGLIGRPPPPARRAQPSTVARHIQQHRGPVGDDLSGVPPDRRSHDRTRSSSAQEDESTAAPRCGLGLTITSDASTQPGTSIFSEGAGEAKRSGCAWRPQAAPHSTRAGPSPTMAQSTSHPQRVDRIDKVRRHPLPSDKRRR